MSSHATGRNRKTTSLVRALSLTARPTKEGHSRRLRARRADDLSSHGTSHHVVRLAELLEWVAIVVVGRYDPPPNRYLRQHFRPSISRDSPRGWASCESSRRPIRALLPAASRARGRLRSRSPLVGRTRRTPDRVVRLADRRATDGTGHAFARVVRSAWFYPRVLGHDDFRYSNRTGTGAQRRPERGDATASPSDTMLRNVPASSVSKGAGVARRGRDDRGPRRGTAEVSLTEIENRSQRGGPEFESRAYHLLTGPARRGCRPRGRSRGRVWHPCRPPVRSANGRRRPSAVRRRRPRRGRWRPGSPPRRRPNRPR